MKYWIVILMLLPVILFAQTPNWQATIIKVGEETKAGFEIVVKIEETVGKKEYTDEIFIEAGLTISDRDQIIKKRIEHYKNLNSLWSQTKVGEVIKLTAVAPVQAKVKRVK